MQDSLQGIKHKLVMYGNFQDDCKFKSLIEFNFLLIQVIFRPVFSKTDIVLNVKANIVNIRQSESLHGALKKTQLAVPETNNDSDVPMEFPDPGARYWPQRYCYDPLNWFVKLLRVSNNVIT